MTQEGADKGRRRFLTGAASAVGGVGAVFTAVPFLAYWNPSARTEAAGAPVEADISKLEPGQLINLTWRGKPIWVFQRTHEELEELPKLNGKLRDPDSKVASQTPPFAQNVHRSIKPAIGVLIGICTHLGCIPLYRPEPGSVDPSWPGGFFCPCHGSKYDLAGRVFEGVPAPMNLAVPPYYFPTDSKIVIGLHKEGTA